MLTKKNKRMVRKMKKYIKTFPLTEKEIDQMIEDITGMAEEAQERNENFETVLGKSVHEFCDDLIYSVGGIRAPGGRKLIRGTSIYFQLLGLWGIVGCLINVCFFVWRTCTHIMDACNFNRHLVSGTLWGSKL